MSKDTAIYCNILNQKAELEYSTRSASCIPVMIGLQTDRQTHSYRAQGVGIHYWNCAVDYRKSLYLAQPILIRDIHLYGRVCFVSGNDSDNRNHGLHMMTKQCSVKVFYSSKISILTMLHLWWTISHYNMLWQLKRSQLSSFSISLLNNETKWGSKGNWVEMI